MTGWLAEIGRFFKTGKKYLFMLLFVFSVFLLSILLKTPSERNAIFSSLQTSVQKAEDQMEKNGQDPNFIEKQLKENPSLRWTMEVFTILGALALIYGIYLDVGFVRKFRRKEAWIQKIAPEHDVRWRYYEIVKVVILFIFFGVCLNFLFLFFYKLIPQPLRANFFLIMHTTISEIAIVGFISYFLKKTEGSAEQALGFNRSIHWKEEIAIGLKAYLAILPVFLGAVGILLAITSLFGYEPPSHPLVGIFIQEEHRMSWLVGYSLFLACILGPIIEEIFFRGFLYPVIRKKAGVAIASAVTALLFALTHENTFAIIPIFVLGLILAYLYEKRGNLIACTTLHMLHNTIFIFYFFLVKQILLGNGSH